MLRLKQIKISLYARSGDDIARFTASLWWSTFKFLSLLKEANKYLLLRYGQANYL